ncbi:Gim5 protein [Saccharomycopsis crataegensis]|uniref:Gim5 protein n=1 Tax=Saccharomycopsis crataegensis TaxID=43959 RepID=A0AAV5QUN5_9ASCO|nr:Gim5 protein [Saccharomycopsis crataegensis]
MSTTTIKLQDLDIDQLATFKKETETELQNFTYSLSALNTAVAKFKSNITNIDEISSSKDQQRELLVPLTASLYVPGKTVNNQKFLCDVGTGYFIEKEAGDAKVFYEKKVKKLNEDSNKLNEIIKNKSDMLNSIETVLQKKVIEARAQMANK